MKNIFFISFLFLSCIASLYAQKPADKQVKSLNPDEKSINTSNLIDANFNFAVKMYLQ